MPDVIVRPTSDRAGGGGDEVGGVAAVRLDAASIRHQFAGVLENDHAVAEQAPTLLGVTGNDAGRFVIRRIGARTGGVVLTPCGVLRLTVLPRSR